MKMLKKLALVSAISMISAGAFAMEAMDDESMASTTGQDGITILVKPGLITDTQATDMGVSTTTQNLIDNAAQGYYANSDNKFAGLSIGSIVVHDDDGLGALGSSTANSGALVIGGGYDKNGNGNFTDAGDTTALKDRTVLLADGSKAITIDIDMIGENYPSAVSGPALTNANNNLTSARNAEAVLLGEADYATASPANKLLVDGTAAVTTAATAVAAANANVAAHTGAILNVKISTPRLAIKTGDIYVANSNAAEAGRDADGATVALGVEVDGTSTSNKIKIMSGLEIVMGAATTTIQLGSEAQGHMIVANTSLIGGLTINNLEVFDAGGTLNPTLGTVVTTGGSFYAKSLSIKDAGGSNLSVISNIDIGSTNTSVYAGAALTAVQGNVDTALTSTVFANELASGSVSTTSFGGAALVGTYSGYANLSTQLSTATTGLSTARDVEANILVPGATYSTLTAGQQTTVNGTASVAAAQATLVTVTTDKAVVDGVSGSAPALAGYRAAAVSTLQTATQAAYNGLVIEMAQFGDAANGADVAINNIALGNPSASASPAATLGDVQILGLNINGTVMVISGH